MFVEGQDARLKRIFILLYSDIISYIIHLYTYTIDVVSLENDNMQSHT